MDYTCIEIQNEGAKKKRPISEDQKKRAARRPPTFSEILKPIKVHCQLCQNYNIVHYQQSQIFQLPLF